MRRSRVRRSRTQNSPLRSSHADTPHRRRARAHAALSAPGGPSARRLTTPADTGSHTPAHRPIPCRPQAPRRLRTRPVHVHKSPGNHGFCGSRQYLGTQPRWAAGMTHCVEHDASPMPPTSLDRPYRVVPAAGADYSRTTAATKPENGAASPGGSTLMRIARRRTALDDASSAADHPAGSHQARPTPTFLRLVSPCGETPPAAAARPLVATMARAQLAR